MLLDAVGFAILYTCVISLVVTEVNLDFFILIVPLYNVGLLFKMPAKMHGYRDKIWKFLDDSLSLS